MSTIPYFPLYAPDWLHDTELMSLEAQGLFIRLLCYCWLHEGLPTDVDDLAKLAHVDKRRFKRIWKEIEHKFIETSPELLANLSVEVSEKSAVLLRDFSKTSLQLWNPRLLKEMLQLAEKQEERRSAGRKGGLSKARNLLVAKSYQNPSIPESYITKKEKVEKEKLSTGLDKSTVGAPPQTPPSAPLQALPKSKSKTKKTEIDYSAIDGLNLDAWADWMEFRKAAKKPKYKTDRMAQSLAKYSAEVQMLAIQHSIENEYQGLFPDKFVGDPSNGGTKKPNVGGNGGTSDYGGHNNPGGYAMPPDACDVKRINDEIAAKFRTREAKKNTTPKKETRKSPVKPKVMHEKRALSTEEEFEKEKARQLKAADEELARRSQ